VNVICELARKNPKNYLALAPILYKILTTSNNNWVLIKIVKLFSALAPSEKRLAKKLEEPLSNIINTTTATSLLYECIQTCTVGLPENKNLLRLCISKLRNFIEDPDQNRLSNSSFSILHSLFFILHSSFLILHSSFFILHSSFFIHHSPFFKIWILIEKEWTKQQSSIWDCAR